MSQIVVMYLDIVCHLVPAEKSSLDYYYPGDLLLCWPETECCSPSAESAGGVILN